MAEERRAAGRRAAGLRLRARLPRARAANAVAHWARTRRLRASVAADPGGSVAALVEHVDRRAVLHPAVNRRRVRDRDAQAAVAGGVHRHFGIAVDRVAADE